jgi:hypothetical protein
MKTPKLLKKYQKGKTSKNTIKYFTTTPKKHKYKRKTKHKKGGSIAQSTAINSITLDELEKYNIADNLHDYGSIFDKASIISLTLKTMPLISFRYNQNLQGLHLDENTVLGHTIDRLTTTHNVSSNTKPYVSYRIDEMSYDRREDSNICHFSQMLTNAGIPHVTPIFLIVDTHYPNFTTDIQQLSYRSTESNLREIYWCKTTETAFDPAGKTTPKTKPSFFVGFGNNPDNGVIYAEQDCSPGNTMGTMFPPWPTTSRGGNIPSFDYNNSAYLDTTLFCSKMMINLLSIKYKNTYETISIIHDKNAKKYIYSDKKLARKKITIFNKGQYKNQWKKYEKICKDILSRLLPGSLTLGTYTNEYQLLSKRMGDQGQALGCLSQNTNFIPITNPMQLTNGCNQSGVDAISSTNGYFCFVSYDRVAICHALNYNVPLVLHLKPTTNRDLTPILYVRKDITSQDIQQLNLKTQIRAIFGQYESLYGRIITNYDRNGGNTYVRIQEKIRSILNDLEQNLNESSEDSTRLNLLYQTIFIIYILLQSPCEILHNYESITPKNPTELDIQTLDSITDPDSLKQKLNLLKGQMELLRNKEQIQKMLDDNLSNIDTIASIGITAIVEIYTLGKYIDEDIYSNIESYKPFTLANRRVSNRGILGALEKDFGFLLITKYVNNDFTEKIQQTSFKHIYHIILSKLSNYFGTHHAYINMAIEKITEHHNTLPNIIVGGTRPIVELRRASDWITSALAGEHLNLENPSRAITHIDTLMRELNQCITLFHITIESDTENQRHLNTMIKDWIIIEDYAKSFYSVILEILFITYKNAVSIIDKLNNNSSEYPEYINIIYTVFVIGNPNILQNMANIFSNQEGQTDPDETDQVTLRNRRYNDRMERQRQRERAENDEIEIAETDYNLLSTQFNILDTDIHAFDEHANSLATIFLDLLNNDTNTYDGERLDHEISNRGGRGGRGKRKSAINSEDKDNNPKKSKTNILKDDSLSDINNVPINDFLILFRFYQYSYKYFNKIIEIDLQSKISLVEKHKLIRTELSNLTHIPSDVEMSDSNKYDVNILDVKPSNVKISDYTMLTNPTQYTPPSVPRHMDMMVHGGKKYKRIKRSKNKTRKKRKKRNKKRNKRTQKRNKRKK